MIPATNAVTAYDVRNGNPLVYNQWVPISVSINSPDDFSDAVATPTSVHVTLCRCRTLEGGKTERLGEDAANRLGRTDRLVHLFIPNIYAPATDTGPDFVPEEPVVEEYPPNATPLQVAQVDARNAESAARVAENNAIRLQEHKRAIGIYPAAVRNIVLADGPNESLMAKLLRAVSTLGTIREVF